MSASAGRVLLMPQGDYNSGTTYHVLDWVRYDNKAYVCKQTSIGNLPTDTAYWQLLVQDGTSPNTKVSYFDNGILGAKNLIGVTAETQTLEGVSFTVGADGKVSVSGTASGSGAYLTLGSATLGPGTYRKTGCPSGGTSSTYYLGGSNSGTDYGLGDTFTLAADTVVTTVIAIEPNYAITGTLLFEPMICLDSDVDTTYRQHAKTNIELTTAFDGLDSDVDDLQSDVSDLQGDVSDLQGDLDGFIGPAYANSSYQVVFDDLDASHGYQIYANTTGPTSYKSWTQATGTNTGIKLTYTFNSTNVSVGNGNTAFYLRELK